MVRRFGGWAVGGGKEPVKFGPCGVRMVASWEAFYPFVYDDLVYPTREWHQGESVRGTLTIGFGETDVAIVQAYVGRRCTVEQAQTWFLDAIASRYEPAVGAIGYPFEQWEEDALVSFTYNLGPGVISDRSSSLRRALDSGDWRNVPPAIRLYNRSGGKVLQGLVRRREAEARLFATGDYGFECTGASEEWAGEDGDELLVAA